MRGAATGTGFGRVWRALPTMLRIGVAETVAYRAEFVVWMLTTTMPLIMLGLWTSVAREAPFAGYGDREFVAYFLAALIVRNVTGSWVAWQLSDEIQRGALSARLLKPVHPFVVLGAGHLAEAPMRGLLALPFALVLLISSGGARLITGPLELAIFVAALAGAWLLTFAILLLIAAVAFYIDRAMAVMDVYHGVYGVMSGYLVPLDLMPPWVGDLARRLPFRSMLGFPVELLCGFYPSPAAAACDLAIQWGFAIGFLLLALEAWRRGLRRHQAFGA